MSGRWRNLWRPRSAGEATPPPPAAPDRVAPTAVADAPVPSPLAPALPRHKPRDHHWLTVVVARPGPAAPVPVPGAKVVVRPFPRTAARPGDPVARTATSADGSAALQLPAGRYAVTATHGGEGRAVTVTLEHSGRALLVLQELGKRVTLTLEATDADGDPVTEAAVEVRTTPAGTPAARSVTDERGVCTIPLPPGAYEVRLGETATRTYLEADTLLRLTAEAAQAEPGPAPVTPYAQRARAATSHVASFDPTSVREELWN